MYAAYLATSGRSALRTVEKAAVLELRARPKRSSLAGEGHPGTLVEPAGGAILLGGPDADTFIAQRARDPEDVKDQGQPDSCALRIGTHEDHRDVQERWIEFPRAIVEPSRLGQRHAYDAWSQRDERQSV